MSNNYLPNFGQYTPSETIRLVVTGKPITKKNSMRMVTNKKTGKVFPIPSKAYEMYRNIFLAQARYRGKPVDYRCNVQAVYYMPTRHRVDLTNLLSATHDLLVDAKVLEDDNSKIVASVDGSTVLYDKDNPRVEITITRKE